MTQQWDGLILSDYEAVMPLTRREKMGNRIFISTGFYPTGWNILHKSYQRKNCEGFFVFRHGTFQIRGDNAQLCKSLQ
jgi:hypothetical protein